MALQVAIQMDPIESIDIEVDSTFALAIEAQERGHNLFYYPPQNLTYREGNVVAWGWPLSVRKVSGGHFSLGPPSNQSLKDFDAILLRQDPPFDMSYITTTHLLEMIADDVLIVNNPFWVRNHPEKLLALRFPDLIPPTAISRHANTLKEFRSKHQDVVVKPLYGNGGVGVFLIRENDLNFNALCEMFLQTSREPLIIQKFLPEVMEGDKRIILVEGEPVGGLNRVPARDEARSNLHVGGTAEKVDLTERDHEICARIGPLLRQCGFVFVGIDVIGNCLTEINVTSPTGLVELQRFDGVNAAGLVWDSIETKLAGNSY